MAVAMRQVEHAIARPRRGAVGMHMAEPDRQLGRGPVGGKLDLEDGRTQDFETLRQRLAVEAERLAIVFALVEGLVGIRVMGAPDAANPEDRKSTRLNSSHQIISYAVFCLKKKKKQK